MFSSLSVKMNITKSFEVAAFEAVHVPLMALGSFQITNFNSCHSSLKQFPGHSTLIREVRPRTRVAIPYNSDHPTRITCSVKIHCMSCNAIGLLPQGMAVPV